MLKKGDLCTACRTPAVSRPVYSIMGHSTAVELGSPAYYLSPSEMALVLSDRELAYVITWSHDPFYGYKVLAGEGIVGFVHEEEVEKS